MAYGDIAIDKNGVLYGSQSNGQFDGTDNHKTGRFFKINLNDNKFQYQELGYSKIAGGWKDGSDLQAALQLSFDAAGERLFGQTHGNVFKDESKYAFQFFEFERKNGEFTGEIKKLDYQPQEYNENADLGKGFRDFGGSTFYPVDPDCVPPVVPGLVLNVKAEGACIEETNASEAIFTCAVEITNPVNTDQDFYYQFLPSPGDSGAYKINGITLNGTELKDSDPNRLEGKFTIKPESFPEDGKIKISAEISRMDGKYFSDEEIELQVDTKQLGADLDVPQAIASLNDSSCLNNKPHTGDLIVEGGYECDKEYLRYSIQTKPQKGDMNVLLELNSKETDFTDNIKSYTEYIEVNNGRTDAKWIDYKPSSEVNLGVEGSLQARVNIDDLRKAGLEEPAELTLKAQEIVLEEPGIPIIDVNYRQLNIDNARAGKNSIKSPKATMNNVANQEGVYYYDKILEHEGNTVGAKVTWKASAGVKQLRFDDWSDKKGARERFQPIITSKDNNQKGGTVDFSWQFFYVGDDNLVNDGDQEVALGRFYEPYRS